MRRGPADLIASYVENIKAELARYRSGKLSGDPAAMEQALQRFKQNCAVLISAIFGAYRQQFAAIFPTLTQSINELTELLRGNIDEALFTIYLDFEVDLLRQLKQHAFSDGVAYLTNVLKTTCEISMQSDLYDSVNRYYKKIHPLLKEIDDVSFEIHLNEQYAKSWLRRAYPTVAALYFNYANGLRAQHGVADTGGVTADANTLIQAHFFYYLIQNFSLERHNTFLDALFLVLSQSVEQIPEFLKQIAVVGDILWLANASDKAAKCYQIILDLSNKYRFPESCHEIVTTAASKLPIVLGHNPPPFDASTVAILWAYSHWEQHRLLLNRIRYPDTAMTAQLPEVMSDALQSIQAQVIDDQRTLAKSMQYFLTVLIKKCEYTLGPVLCDYALVAMGSLAREECCLYSDIEFMIIRSPTPVHADLSTQEVDAYFKALVTLLELKVIALGESITVTTALEDRFEVGTAFGFQFDQSGQTPFSNKGIAYYGTPESLATLLQPQVEAINADTAHAAINEVPLFFSDAPARFALLDAQCVYGNRTLFTDFMAACNDQINRCPTDKTYPLRQPLALYLPKDQIVQHAPLTPETEYIDIKEFSRLPLFIVSTLTLYFAIPVVDADGVPSSNSLDKIDALCRAQQITPAIARGLRTLLEFIWLLRSKAHAHYGREDDGIFFTASTAPASAFVLSSTQQDALMLLSHSVLTPAMQLLQEFVALAPSSDSDDHPFRQPSIEREAMFTVGALTHRWIEQRHVSAQSAAPFVLPDLSNLRTQEAHYSARLIAFIQQMIEETMTDVQEIAGRSVPCAFDIRLLGDIARQEANPYSDFACLIVIEDSMHQDYFALFKTVLTLKVHVLGDTLFLDESPTLRTPTLLLRDDHGGRRCRVDVLDVETLQARLNADSDGIRDIDLFYSTVVFRQGVLDVPPQQPVLTEQIRYLAPRVEQHTEIDLQTQCYEPLKHALLCIGTEQSMQAKSLMDWIEQWIEQGVIERSFGKLCRQMLMRLSVLRHTVYAFYRAKNDKVCLEADAADPPVLFVLNSEQAALVQGIQQVILEPLYGVLNDVRQSDDVLPTTLDPIGYLLNAAEAYAHWPILITALIDSYQAEPSALTEAEIENYFRLLNRVPADTKPLLEMIVTITVVRRSNDAVIFDYFQRIPEESRQFYYDSLTQQLSDAALLTPLTMWPNADGTRIHHGQQKIAWLNTLDVMVSEEREAGAACTIEIMSPSLGKRYVTAKALSFLQTTSPPNSEETWLDDQGLFNMGNREKLPGNHLTIPLCIDPLNVHLKIFPEYPGVELAMSFLSQLIIGEDLPHVELWIWKSGEHEYPVLVSGTLPGDDLVDALVENPDLVGRIDHYHYCQQVLIALLANPEDSHPSNVKVVLNEMTQRYRLSIVDRDRHFVEPIKDGKVLMKSTLYCFDEMHQPFHADLIKRFLYLNPIKVLTKWIELLDRYNMRIAEMFGGKLNHFYYNNRFKTNVGDNTLAVFLIRKRFLIELHQKMQLIQDMFSTNEVVTPMQLLHRLHPDYADHCNSVFAEHDNLIARFDAAFRDGVSIKLHASGRKVYQSLATKKLLEETVFGRLLRDQRLLNNEWIDDFSTARKELLMLNDSYDNIQAARKGLLMSNATRFMNLQTPLSRMAALHKIFHDTNRGQQRYIIQTLCDLVGQDREAITELDFSECMVFDDASFKKIVSTLKYINSLTLSNCYGLTEKSITSVIVGCHHLQALSLDSSHKLKKLKLTKRFGTPCRELTTLRITNCHNVEEIVVQAPQLQELVIRNTRNLVYLKVRSDQLFRLDIIDAPKVDFHYLTRNLAINKPVSFTGRAEHLIQMIREHNAEAVAFYLEKGAAIDERAIHGMTPFLVAASEGGEDTSILDSMLAEVDNEQIPQLLSHQCDAGRNALFYAVLNGRFRAVTVLCEQAPPGEHIDRFGNTVLMMAALGQKADMLCCLLGVMTKRLIRETINLYNHAGCSALFYAALAGDNEMVQLLVDTGATSTLPNPLGYTALDCAAARGHKAILTLLMHQTEDIDTTNFLVMVRYRLVDGVSIQRYVNDSANRGQKDADDNSLLHLVAGFSDAAVLIGLLESMEHDAVLLNASNQRGHTPLHLAALCLVSAADRIVRIHTLCGVGSEVDAVDHQGNTPLCVAACVGHYDAVTALLMCGANPLHTNAENKTPYDLADAAGHSEIAQAIAEAIQQAAARSSPRLFTPPAPDASAPRVRFAEAEIIHGAR